MIEQTATPNTQVVETKTETPTETQNTSPPAEPKPDQMASKFAALAKKERQARLLHAQAKTRAEELAKREAAIAERERLWEEEFKQSPLEALKKRNLTYQDLTNAALNDGKFQPDVEIKRVQDEIQRFRVEQEEKEKKAIEAQQAAQQKAESEAIEGFKTKISDHIDANSEKFELTKLYDASELVFQTVEEHFERNKKILSIDEACSLVEQYLESELERASKESKKFKSKFLSAKQEQQEKTAGKSTTTLTNSFNSSATPSLLPAKTEEDRIKRALAALG